MNLIAHRARLSVASAMAALLAAGGVALGSLLQVAADTGQALEAVAPRHARLAGIRDAAAAIAQAATAAEALLERHTYPPSTATDRIGTDLQQRLRAAAEAAGVAMVGSQIVAGREDGGLENVPVSVTLEAGLAQLQQMLQVVAAQTPAIHVDSITIQSTRGRNTPAQPRLTVQVRFSALRRLP